MGLSASVGISSPWILKLLFSGTPFFKMRLRDLLGLKLSLAHVANSSSLFNNHRMAISASAIAVTSSINARQGGCCVPSIVLGPLHSPVASVIRRFIAVINKVTEIEQPAIMPLSNGCQFVVRDHVGKRIFIQLRCCSIIPLTLSGIWLCFRTVDIKLCGRLRYAFSRSSHTIARFFMFAWLPL